ncbi:ABC transporter ATP-binding protein [Holdemania filiformis]|uniref:ABC transporter ATP-binding protein n=1 Tax=Holdemania filiformis TaxID=61171 RepID=UPI00242C2572|nr:ABC transporter ATP-binding protein [Holdemania filiformis]
MSLKTAWQETCKFIKMMQKSEPHLLVYLFLTAMMTATVPFIPIYFSAQILDQLIAGQFHSAMQNVYWMIGISGVLGITSKALNQRFLKIQDCSENKISQRIVEKAYQLEYEELEKTETLDEMRKADQGCNGGGSTDSQLRDLLQFLTMLFSILYSLIFVGVLIMQILKSSQTRWMALASLFFLFALYALVILIGSILSAKAGELLQKMRRDNVHNNAMSNYIGNLGQSVTNDKDIRIFQMQKLIMHLFNKTVVSADFYLAWGTTNGKINGVITFLTQLASGMTYLVIGIIAMQGTIGIGEVMLYANAILRFTTSLVTLAASYNNIAYRYEYLNSYEAFIQRPNMSYEGTLPVEKRDDGEYHLTFDHVSYRYPGQSETALKDISFDLELKKHFAVVGRNGAGKTTFIKLMCRLAEPTEGRILLNGIDIRKYAFEEYVQIFSVVFQDFKLMEMPLGENLAASANVDDQKAMRVLEEVGLSARVAGMDKGLKTQLGKENGEGILLSGGEAQKAAIARALYKDAPVVILDEPTAALDPLAEAEIYENFNELVKDKTSIFISHRMSSCKFCDEIVVFDHGQIVQRGTHDQLAGQPGLYQELWEAQAQYYRHSHQMMEMIGSQV